MDFEEFRKHIESMLSSIAEFELQEFHFAPYSFGNGIVAYRINGRNHKFLYDGRENELIWLIGKSHEKYNESDYDEFKRKNTLELSSDELKSGITRT